MTLEPSDGHRQPCPPCSASSGDDLPQQAVALAERLLRTARQEQTAAEQEQAARLARMMADPAGKELTIALVDQAFRSHHPDRIADQLRHLLHVYGTPHYMDWWERVALALGGAMSHYLPNLVVPPVIARLRQETRAVILPGEEGDLRRYLQQRRQDGMHLNLNQLGEAILGEGEAQRRMQAYLDLLAREDVEYISVKVSSVFSQLNLVAFDATKERVKERLRVLYRQAMAHHYTHPDSRVTPKFVNLDMEAYTDLHLTVAAFTEVLDEPEFLTLSAGIVLQAYLPDAFPIQQDLTTWAMARCARGGVPIKIRIVKGANLAMEQVEAALHGWPQAPYTIKLETDANFKRMVTYGSQPEQARVVQLGVASHNLFDVAYGLLLRHQHSVEDAVEFEMLEGMANHQARAVQHEAGGLLLYAPVVKTEDFHSAIAYLVRRLDENTAPENFLHDLFSMEPDSDAWRRQRDCFLAACQRQNEVPDRPRRTQDRRTEQPGARHHQPFDNEPDTDWSLPANQAWIKAVIERWREMSLEPIPLQIGGEFVHSSQQAEGIDPSWTHLVAYRYALADPAHVHQALDVALEAQPAWGACSLAARQAVLLEVAAELARRRGDLIGSMLLDGAKTVAEADPEVSEAIDFARYYAQALDLSEEVADCAMTPLGVVVVTPPWNFPLSIPLGGVLAALMAGNAVILKPAPEAVLVGWQIAQTLWAAGVPLAVLQFLPCPDNAVGQALITDPRTAAVILTGSIETARLFQDWRPELRLFAETSGKNALMVTAMADRDQAIKDLVRSAFSHNGQKCSAASLGILEAEVYDDPTFRRQLQDAAASLAVGPAWDLSSMITPLTQPPSPKLLRALTCLEPGETWLLEPQPLPLAPGETPAPETHRLWSPGIKLGVQPGSFFHTTECFGPVLGLMRAEDVEEALAFANAVPFGLTGGIHTLDDREIARWQDQIQVGNAYVNRSITGAIVRRQPFGGWKGSNVGPGAKAGGPNYVLQLGTWHQVDLPTRQADPAPGVAAVLERCQHLSSDDHVRALWQASARSYAWAWQSHYCQEHDPSQILGELNLFRYRPVRGIMVRVEVDTALGPLVQIVLAALTCEAPLTVSLSPGRDDLDWLADLSAVQVVIEDEASLIARLGAGDTVYDRLRAIGPLSTTLRRALNTAGISVVDVPVLANGRLELRYYLREQALSQTIHRYGNIIKTYRQN
jgi:RHH-type transcriptional regulator, proline utilization regulon repressor / proline dehydrogenase / delta 1-pyrroline-5-carboxylate dehydrogenase